MSGVGTFDEHILGIVDDFLQTVVVVDDRAFSGQHSETVARAGASTRGGGRGRAVEVGLTPPEADAHDLDPKAVTDAFAQDGLVCSFLSPEPGENVDEKFLRAARRADLIVLDWVLHRDEGRKTLRLVKKILAKDEGPDRRRLRTIAVYTGQTNLHDVADQLAETLDEAYTDCTLERQQHGLAMTKGPVRAAVFAKEHVENLGSDLEERRVPFSELPDRLRGEFATLTRGLVTGVALAALAALRDDTHRILQTLGPKLDPAHLGHRAALPVPQEAETQAVSLVAAEIRSVIEDNEVDRYVQMPALKLWLDDAKREGLRFGELIDDKKRLSQPQVEAILTLGLGTEDGIEQVAEIAHGKNYFRNTVKRQATSIFCASADHAASSDADFAHRTMMRTLYSEPPRTLQLGTIVQSDLGYHLCVQPLCDSVRLTKAHPFPFLPLQQVASDGKPDFVVQGVGSAWVYLRLGRNPRDLVMAPFDPRPRSAVTATTKKGVHSFRDTNGVEYVWIAELKPDFAQRVAFDLAQQFARIAVEEAEIFRLARR